MNRKSIYFKLLTVLLCITMLVACSTKTTPEAETQTSQNMDETKDISSTISELVTYDKDDYYSDWKNENPVYIELNGTSATVKGAGAVMKGSKITITAAGVYVLSGKLDNGQILVDVEDKGRVRLVLNGTEIHSADNTPIYVKQAGKTIITLQDGTENVLSDGVKYILEDASTDEPSATIFSKDSLTINGSGTVTVRGNYKDGIASKDDLKITGGNINIYSADDGLMGRDMVAVKDGRIAIEAGGDGIKASNDTDASKGLIAIEGGSFDIKSQDDAIHSNKDVAIVGGDITINAGDDGIHADSSIKVEGGKINIKKSYEGIESSVVTIAGGEIHVIASDDGINIAGGNDGSAVNGRPGQNNFSSSSDNKLNISGGYIAVDSIGDGLDSNGSIYMSGGTVLVSGPTANMNGALDYDGVFEMTGGFLISAGSAGMAQAPSEQSTQNSVAIIYSQMQQAGMITHLQDSKGNTIATFAPKKNYQLVVISSPELKKDSAYTFYTAGASTGSNTDGLYKDGEYMGGTKLVGFTVSKNVMWMSETGETTAKGFAPGGAERPARPDGQNPPTGQPGPGMRERPNRLENGTAPTTPPVN